MTTRYEAGRSAEYRAQTELEAQGYTTARAAGSKGKADVLAWNGTHLRLIQVKTFLKRLGNYQADIRALQAMQVPPGTTKELWIRQRGTCGWYRQLDLTGGVDDVVAPPLSVHTERHTNDRASPPPQDGAPA